MAHQPHCILVYQMGSIGDTVVTIPALKAIRRHYGPDTEICLLHETRREVNTTPADLLAGSSEVDRFLSYPFAKKKGRKLLSAAVLWWHLWHEHFQAVVYLAPSQRTAKQVRRDMRFFRWCRIPRFIGFRAFPEEYLYPVDLDSLPGRVAHEALCRLERLRLDGIDVSIETDISLPVLRLPQHDLDKALQWLGLKRQKPGKMLVGICPGAKKPANFWPVQRFIEIGRRLAENGKYELMVVGGPKEAQTGDKMVKAWGEGLNAAGQFSVLRSAALLSQCAFIIGLDTGTTHLAAALGTPCVALYGAQENPGRWEPLGEGHIVLRKKVPCAGCRLIMIPCPVAGHPCMTGIDVETVWRAILQMEMRLAGRQHFRLN
jgi:ADP-heptose:LPS heptosyltransferase